MNRFEEIKKNRKFRLTRRSAGSGARTSDDLPLNLYNSLTFFNIGKTEHCSQWHLDEISQRNQLRP